MVDGPRNQEQLGEVIDQNRDRITRSVRAAELARVAGVPLITLDDVMEQKPAPLLSETGRGIVDEWLAGVEAARSGTFDVFFIELPDGSSMSVTAGNADEVESDIRTHFAPYYPEVAPVTPEA